MSSIDLLLLDLLGMAEAPLYSAYRWLGRQIGRQVPMREFFRLLAPLVDKDIVRLWEVDSRTNERRRLRELPLDLEEQYSALRDLDETFDPFGLSLTLGSGVEPTPIPDWEVDFDFKAQHFTLSALPAVIETADHEIQRLFPDLDFSPENRSAEGDRIRITGSIRQRTASP